MEHRYIIFKGLLREPKLYGLPRWVVMYICFPSILLCAAAFAFGSVRLAVVLIAMNLVLYLLFRFLAAKHDSFFELALGQLLIRKGSVFRFRTPTYSQWPRS